MTTTVQLFLAKTASNISAGSRFEKMLAALNPKTEVKFLR
jgi:hypothetical protein